MCEYDDFCYECVVFGNDYHEDENGNLICNCPQCSCDDEDDEWCD